MDLTQSGWAAAFEGRAFCSFTHPPAWFLQCDALEIVLALRSGLSILVMSARCRRNPKLRKATIMARKQTTTNTPATQAPAATHTPEKRAQWSAERVRLAQLGLGGRSGNGRYARLADMLATAEALGEARVTFAEANARMGSHRAEGPAGAASWRTMLQRFGQVDPGAAGWRIDAEAGAIVRRD